jgi:hypothetical protein
MIWGGDLYNLPGLDPLCYEPLTLKKYIQRDCSAKTMLYRLKVLLFHSYFKKNAYKKVKHILTWMRDEYEFALQHLPVHADHKFFFYENQFPYGKLDSLAGPPRQDHGLLLMIGNSGSPVNNHLDVVRFLAEHKVVANLAIPVSYGDKRYISFLKKKLSYPYGNVEFVERYMTFEEYLQFLNTVDALIMNTVRPQGYGNILMMMYMNKPVFFNQRNISLSSLERAGIQWWPLSELSGFLADGIQKENREKVMGLFSHARLLDAYRDIF